MTTWKHPVIQLHLYIWLVGEGVVVSNGCEKHLYADDEVLYQLQIREVLISVAT